MTANSRGVFREHQGNEMNMKPQQVRQGDVQLQPVSSLPSGCTEIPADGNRIVLAYGEVTGHAHAIYDYKHDVSMVDELLAQASMQTPTGFSGEQEKRNKEIYEAAIARAQTKARLWRDAGGDRYLEVVETVTLRHEEHTQHMLTPGIYKLPVQVEYTPAELRRVAD